MLETFIGGYLFHPAALDYSGDTCQNGCAYCFANINKEYRRGNLAGAIRSFYKKEPETYTDLLLKEGYPICISNRSDPFSPRNIKETQGLFTHLAGMKNGIFIQTKCSSEMEETLSLLGDRRDVIIYITITSMRDDIIKIVEPNAPAPSERLNIAKRLHDAGYLVMLAVNPCTEAWMPRNDLESLTDFMRQSGMNHIAIEMLDIKHRRLEALGESRKLRMGEAIKTLGLKNRAYVRECTQYLVSQGFAVAKKGMPFKSTLFADLKQKLGLTMPALQDFVNHCFDKYAGGGLVSYAEFESVIARDGIFLKTVRQNTIRNYLLRSGFVSWKRNQHVHSHKELLRILWNDRTNRMSIQKHCLFGVVVGKDGKPTLDQDGNVQLLFSTKPNLAKKKEVIEL